MSFLVLHADRHVTALADDPIVPASEVGRFRDTIALMDEAGRLHAAAVAATEAARETAYAEGHEAGRLAGRAAGEAEMTAELFRLALRDGEAQRERQASIARLAIEVVRHIAGEVGDPAMIAALAERAAATVAPDIATIVRVPPDALAETRARLGEREGLTIESDPTLSGVDCVVETPLGRTHAGLDTQIAQIERVWRDSGRG